MIANRLAVAAMLVLGCSGDREARHDTPPGDTGGGATTVGRPTAAVQPAGVCRYITEAEATDVFDEPMRYRSRDPAGQHCALAPASGDVFHGVSVEFRVARGSTGLYDFLAAQKAAEPVGRVGDKAVWLPAGDSRGNFAAVKGGDAVSVAITDLSGKGDLKDRARAVAKKVLEHLP